MFHGASGDVHANRCVVVGQVPAGGEKAEDLREGLGMADLDSPIWASDHRGVVADLTRTGG